MCVVFSDSGVGEDAAGVLERKIKTFFFLLRSWIPAMICLSSILSPLLLIFSLPLYLSFYPFLLIGFLSYICLLIYPYIYIIVCSYILIYPYIYITVCSYIFLSLLLPVSHPLCISFLFQLFSPSEPETAKVCLTANNTLLLQSVCRRRDRRFRKPQEGSKVFFFKGGKRKYDVREEGGRRVRRIVDGDLDGFFFLFLSFSLTFLSFFFMFCFVCFFRFIFAYLNFPQPVSSTSFSLFILWKYFLPFYSSPYPSFLQPSPSPSLPLPFSKHPSPSPSLPPAFLNAPPPPPLSLPLF